MEPGNFYHIYNRGNNKENIFFEEKNYYYFLKKFDEYLSAFSDVYAYCLMPNHFHFLIKIKETSDKTSEVSKTSEVFTASYKTSEVLNQRGSKKLTPLEKAFKDFFISYAKSINRQYSRTGSLFQAKFKKKKIENDGYFTSIIQYIHANPVSAKLCSTYHAYRYSSYNAIIGNAKTKIKKGEVLEWFGGRDLFIKIHQERKLEADEIKKFISK